MKVQVSLKDLSIDAHKSDVVGLRTFIPKGASRPETEISIRLGRETIRIYVDAGELVRATQLLSQWG